MAEPTSASGEITHELCAVRLMLRTFTAHLAELGDRLAQQAGEEVKRPLTEAQLRRAFDALEAEKDIVWTLLASRWGLPGKPTG